MRSRETTFADAPESITTGPPAEGELEPCSLYPEGVPLEEDEDAVEAELALALELFTGGSFGAPPLGNGKDRPLAFAFAFSACSFALAERASALARAFSSLASAFEADC